MSAAGCAWVGVWPAASRSRRRPSALGLGPSGSVPSICGKTASTRRPTGSHAAHAQEREAERSGPWLSSPRHGWRVVCSFGWHTELSRQWAAYSAAKSHPKLGPADVEHTMQIEERPDPAAGDRQQELPLA